MADTVHIIVDDVKLEVPKGLMVVDAAKRAGIGIPVFCYHPKLPAVGMCRMCLVEIGTPKIDQATKQPVRDEAGNAVIAWMPKLQTACTTVVSEGMAVRTGSKVVRDAQREILEFLLTSHPLDCPICQKGGECPLQNLTIAYGPGTSRFPFNQKMDLDKHKPLGELIFLDEERCIQCSRCIRFQDELAEDHVLAFDQRGRALQIATFSQPGFNSKFSGNTTDVCPVGALLTTDYRHAARPWEVKPVPSICMHCPVGCNLTLNVRVTHTYIARVMPRQNELVNEIWICDKGRFAYHFASSPQRVKQPLVRRGGELVETSWDEALALVAEKLKAAGDAVGGIAGDRLSNEDLYMFQALMRRGLHSANVDHYPNELGGGEVIGQVGLARDSNMSDWGPGTTVLVIASDLEEEAPIWWLRVNAAAKRGATLVVANARPTKLDRHAAFKLRYAYGDETRLLNGLLSAVLDGGLENRDFLAARVDGLDDLRQQIAQEPAASGEPTPGQARQDAERGELQRPASPATTSAAGTPAITPDGNYAPASLSAVAQAIGQAQNLVIIYGGDGLSYTGSQAVAQLAANLLIVTGHVGRPNNGLLAVWPHNNTQGAWDMGVRPDLLPGYAPAPQTGLDAQAMLSSGSKMHALFIAGADPAGEDPDTIAALRHLDFLVVSELFLTETAKLAHVVLPAQSFVEREGTYTSGERRVQRYYPAVPPMRAARPDWRILADIAARLGTDLPAASAAAVQAHIAQNVPIYAGMTYAHLSKVEPQYPDVGGRDLYYGGTAYRNTGGLGIVWPVPAEDPARRLVVKAVTGTRLVAPLQAVPVTLLYDAGTLMNMPGPGELGGVVRRERPPILAGRVPAPYIALHPADAAQLGLVAGDPVAVKIGTRDVALEVRVDADVPAGAALLPRGLAGVGRIKGPFAVEIKPRAKSGERSAASQTVTG